jgi:hypothetical protein
LAVAHGAVILVVVEVTLKCSGAGNRKDDHLFHHLDLDHAHFALVGECSPHLALLFLPALCDGVHLQQPFLHQSTDISAPAM